MSEFGRFLGGDMSRRQFLQGTALVLSEAVGLNGAQAASADMMNHSITPSFAEAVDLNGGVESAETANSIDTLKFFKSPNTHLTLDGSHKLSQSVEGNMVSYIKWGDKTKYEQYELNENGIYLRFDRSDAPQQPYRFYPGKWMNAKTFVGDEIDMAINHIQWYNTWCEPLAENAPQPPSGIFPYKTKVIAFHDEYDTGGSLGIVPAIELEYDLRPQGGNYEHYIFGEDLGMIRWSEYDGRTNDQLQSSHFNRMVSGIIDPDLSVACR